MRVGIYESLLNSNYLICILRNSRTRIENGMTLRVFRKVECLKRKEEYKSKKVYYLQIISKPIDSSNGILPSTIIGLTRIQFSP